MINAASDKYEQEADVVAKEVVQKLNSRQFFVTVLPTAPPTTYRQPEVVSAIIQRDWLEKIGNATSSTANIVGDWIDDFSNKSRKLGRNEIVTASEVYGNTIDYSQVILERNNLYNAGLPRAVCG